MFLVVKDYAVHCMKRRYYVAACEDYNEANKIKTKLEYTKPVFDIYGRNIAEYKILNISLKLGEVDNLYAAISSVTRYMGDLSKACDEDIKMYSDMLTDVVRASLLDDRISAEINRDCSIIFKLNFIEIEYDGKLEDVDLVDLINTSVQFGTSIVNDQLLDMYRFYQKKFEEESKNKINSETGNGINKLSEDNKKSFMEEE